MGFHRFRAAFADPGLGNRSYWAAQRGAREWLHRFRSYRVRNALPLSGVFVERTPLSAIARNGYINCGTGLGDCGGSGLLLGFELAANFTGGGG